jgi:hypothetical protein
MANATETFPDETGLAHGYAKTYGSAAAAVEAIEAATFWQDATTRAVLRDLRTMRHAEWKAADVFPFSADQAEQVAA